MKLRTTPCLAPWRRVSSMKSSWYVDMCMCNNSICDSDNRTFFNFSPIWHNNFALNKFYNLSVLYVQQITEAGHELGKELALQYARLGAIVVCLDTNQQLIEDTEKEIKKTIKRKNAVFAYQYVVIMIHNIIYVFAHVTHTFQLKLTKFFC